jgi:16S rRNA (uracil1498-N3)-methyltransferase
MTATPAWPPQSTPRLFVDTLLGPDVVLRIEGAQAHYLIAVMRFKVGDPLKLCDNKTGEWLGIVDTVGKRDLVLLIRAHLRPRDPVPDLWLLAAPIKKARNDFLVEKACELGVAHYRPVITRRTVIDRVNSDRLRATMIEAAEQCGRTALPEISEPIKLAALLRDWPLERTLFFADESGGGTFAATSAPAAILIGPEGGFDDEERTAIRALPQAIPISLGPRILRAETAAIAAMAVWMAQAGDW